MRFVRSEKQRDGGEGEGAQAPPFASIFPDEPVRVQSPAQQERPQMCYVTI